MQMHLIKICDIFGPNLGQIYPSGKKKIAFSAILLRQIWRHGNPETDLMVKNSIFPAIAWYILVLEGSGGLPTIYVNGGFLTMATLDIAFLNIL